jgi:beta-lactamase class D
MKKAILFLIFVLSIAHLAEADTKCFRATENRKVIKQEGECESRHACCSTFKIAISLMGYNEGILINETQPELPFEPGYYDLFEVWKQPHNPKTWIKNSCVWYSQVITPKLGMKKFKDYVEKFNYGNEDVSGDVGRENGLTHSWLSSSLQISPGEQIAFLQKLLDQKLPVSQESHELTKKILFVEDLLDGWKLYGKTGSGYLLNQDGSRNKDRQIGWFVGWIEKGDHTIIFAHYIEDEDKQDVPAGKRAKETAKDKLINLIQSNTGQS